MPEESQNDALNGGRLTGWVRIRKLFEFDRLRLRCDLHAEQFRQLFVTRRERRKIFAQCITINRSPGFGWAFP
jgi:hypothetical protein